MNFNIPKFPFHVPWFMLDISNYQLITSTTVPSDIKDTKDVILTEIPVPGMNYQPVMMGGGGNRHVSFTLPLIKRNNTVGNLLMLKQFDMLRNQTVSLLSFSSGQFTSFPKVLYYWGVGSIPLIYFVKKCEATHKQGWVNELGYPQFSEIAIELILDEDNTLYKGEEVFRKLSALAGMVTGLIDTVQTQINKKTNPY